MNFLDQPAPIRPGEELDVKRLQQFLQTHQLLRDEQLSIMQFPRGFSNLTYWLRCGEREFVLRRSPHGAHVKSGHDMGREYRMLAALIAVYPKVPRPLLFCEDAGVIGSPFYVMERVHGVILRNHAPDSLGLSSEVMQGLSQAFIDNLATLHRLDIYSANLAELGKPQGYVARQVEGWTQRYRTAQTDEMPQLEEAMAWLPQHLPAESGASIIHNDYKYDNLVLDPADRTNIITVLDWEMATIGDPLMDLGTSLGYWIEAGDPAPLRMFGLTHLPGNLDRRQLVARYLEQRGCAEFDPLFYYVYGVFKIAAIAQQIYGRFRRGATQDARFAQLLAVVRACGELSSRALDRNRVHQLFQ